MDETCGFICYLVSPYLFDHIKAENAPNEIWTKFSTLFGTQDEMTGHQLEVELMNMFPNELKSIQ